MIPESWRQFWFGVAERVLIGLLSWKPHGGLMTQAWVLAHISQPD